MKEGSPQPLFAIALLILSFSGLVLFWTPIPISAQSPCMSPGPLSSTMWKQGAQVTVLFHQGDFSPDEHDAILTALLNWNAANGANGNNSSVVFSGFGETSA